MEMPQDSQGTALSSSDEVGKEAEYNYFTMPLDGIQKFFVAVSDLEVEPNLGMCLRFGMIPGATIDIHCVVPLPCFATQDWLHPHCLCCHPSRS